jgi:hypothetical protein
LELEYQKEDLEYLQMNLQYLKEEVIQYLIEDIQYLKEDHQYLKEDLQVRKTLYMMAPIINMLSLRKFVFKTIAIVLIRKLCFAFWRMAIESFNESLFIAN